LPAPAPGRAEASSSGGAAAAGDGGGVRLEWGSGEVEEIWIGEWGRAGEGGLRGDRDRD